MRELGLSLAIVLSLIAALHLFWGLGGTWPGRDSKSLARLVVGARGIEHMPPRRAGFAVAACLLIAAYLPLALVKAAYTPFGIYVPVVGGYICLAIFLGRGIAAYTSAFRRLFPEEPFATLDRWFYAPLCLAIAAAFALLLDYALNLRCGSCG